MFPRPLATNIFFQYTVTGDLNCMECMIYDSLFVFVSFSLCINVCDFNVIWGYQEDNPNVVMLLPPMSTSISIYVVNVLLFDMYKEWNWEIISCILIWWRLIDLSSKPLGMTLMGTLGIQHQFLSD